MIEYIILIAALVAAIASVYIIYNLDYTTDEKPDEKTVVVVQKHMHDASGAHIPGKLELPYATDNIMSVDDYEYNMVFQNEGDRGMTKATRNLLMSKYPMDWTVQPPSSNHFQQGLASYRESFQNPSELPAQNPYTAIDGDMSPPGKTEEILATYTPKKPNELTTYDAADAKDIIDKIYGAKGLVADFKQTGDNTYTIMGTRAKDEKVVYEDEVSAQAPTSSQPVPSAGEFIVPATVEHHKSVDPFFTVNPNNRSRDGKWDYASWTPGLERMFAPTEPQPNWY
jgi:hypothetical protein